MYKYLYALLISMALHNGVHAAAIESEKIATVMGDSVVYNDGTETEDQGENTVAAIICIIDGEYNDTQRDESVVLDRRANIFAVDGFYEKKEHYGRYLGNLPQAPEGSESGQDKQADDRKTVE